MCKYIDTEYGQVVLITNKKDIILWEDSQHEELLSDNIILLLDIDISSIKIKHYIKKYSTDNVIFFAEKWNLTKCFKALNIGGSGLIKKEQIIAVPNTLQLISQGQCVIDSEVTNLLGKLIKNF